MDVGEPSGTMLTNIENHIMADGNHGHGDDLQLFAMRASEHDLTVTIVPESFATVDERAQLIADVTAAVGAAFRENAAYAMTCTAPFTNFSFSKLGGELHDHFSELESVRFSLTDIQTEMNVPRLESLEVVIDD